MNLFFANRSRWLRTALDALFRYREAGLRRAQLRLEHLEARQTPSVIIVNTTSDAPSPPAGTTTLRQAVTQANTTPGSVIQFDSSLNGQTITLAQVGDQTYGNSGLLVTGSFTIDGFGNNGPQVTLSGGNQMRLFRVASGASLTLQGVTLTGGAAIGGNGGAPASGSGMGGGGGAGLGGALFNQGTLTINQSTLTGNLAMGGAGGLGRTTSTHGSYFGGAGGGGMSGAGWPAYEGGGGQGGGINGGAPGNTTTFNGCSGKQGGAGGGGGGGGGCVPESGTIEQDGIGGRGGFGGGGGAPGIGISSSGRTKTFPGPADGGFGGGSSGNLGGNEQMSTGPGISVFAGGIATIWKNSSGEVLGSFGGGGAGMGGAIFNWGTLQVVNSTITGNRALGGPGNPYEGSNTAAGAGWGLGGGIFNYNANASIYYSTLYNNFVSYGTPNGDEIYSLKKSGSATVTIANSIVASTFASTNVVLNDSTLNLTGPSVGNGAGWITTNHGSIHYGAPLYAFNSGSLQALANNGGPTPTLALNPSASLGFPNTALGNGSILASSPFASYAATDQRGYSPRTYAGSTTQTDIGAYATVAQPPTATTVAGSDAGLAPQLHVYNADGSLRHAFMPFAPVFRGGVRVARGDVNGDRVPDFLAAAGPGGGPHVVVFDGRTGGLLGGPLGSFMALADSFRGGVNVAAGDVNADGFADILAAADASGGPVVQVFSGKDSSLLASFLAYDARFTGGVRVASADLNSDGYFDILTAAGPGGGPHVKAFSGRDGSLLHSFMAFLPGYAGGVYIAAGDLTGDLRPDIVASAGPHGGTAVTAFDGRTLAVLFNGPVFEPTFPGGVRVGVRSLPGGRRDELVLGVGPGYAPLVRRMDVLAPQLLDAFFAFDPRSPTGVFVA